MRRVVVTGLGMVTPLACGVEPTWQRLIDGQSGARRIESFDVSDLPAKIACQVPRGDGSDGSFNADQWMEPKEQRKVDDFIIFAMGAAHQALDDASWKPASYDDQIKTGVMIGSGIGGLTGIAETAIVLKERGPRPPDQPRLRLCFDRARSQGAQSRRRDGLLDRRACDRRRRATCGARRCRGHGGGRGRISDLAHRHGGVRRLSRAVHELQ
jgi:beta-ketoacyl synthase-like protein